MQVNYVAHVFKLILSLLIIFIFDKFINCKFLLSELY